MNPGLNTLGRPFSRLLIACAIITAFPAHADDKAEIDKLKAQIQELDQKLRVLDRKQEIATEEAAAKQKTAPIVNVGDKGFGFKSADGQFEYKLRGLLQLDYRNIGGTAFPDAVDGFTARRIRPTFEGTVFGKYGFRFTPEFGENKSSVVDAYLDVKEDPAFQVRVGKFKPFVGLERLQSAADIKFIERSYVSNNILPNRDLGVSVFGDVLNKKVNYSFGVFNGVSDGGEATTTQDIDNGKEYTARLFTTPFIDADNGLQGLGFGVATTYGQTKGSTSLEYRGRISGVTSGLGTYKTPGQANSFFSYQNTISTTTPTDDKFVVANGQHLRWTPQAYYYKGPLGVIAEYAESSQAVARYIGTGNTATSLTNSDTLNNYAWQIAASWLITGEEASFKGVKPFSPFKAGSEGGWGAFELLARFQENKLDQKASTYGDTLKGYALGARTFGVGLNWYLSDSSKLAINYDVTTLQDVTAGTLAKGALKDTREQLVVARYQLVF